MKLPPLDTMFTHPDWPPLIAEGLRRMVAETPVGDVPPIAAIDFDETCIRGDISHALLADMDARTVTNLYEAYEASCIVDRADAYARLVEILLVCRTEAEVRDWALRTLDQGLASGELRLRAPMIELIYWLQRAGWQVWVVTASPQVVVQAIASRLGIAADRVVGMVTEVNEHGVFQPKLIEPATYRAGKPIALAARTGRAPTFAAGDSETDTELLAAASYGLIVDRGDQTLRALATERGYWVVGGW